MSLSIGIRTKIFKTLHACFNLYNIGVNKEWLILLGAKFQLRVTYICICIMVFFRFYQRMCLSTDVFNKLFINKEVLLTSTIITNNVGY